MSRGEQIEQLIVMHKRRLQKLKEASPEAKKQSKGMSNQLISAEILIEIEDLEAEIQQLQTELTQDNVKNKDEIQGKISAYERRLQALKRHRGFSGPAVNQEITELEVEIQQLQTELENGTITHKDELQAVLFAKQRRLQSLAQAQARTQRSNEQEIIEIEAEIQRLELELERLD